MARPPPSSTAASLEIVGALASREAGRMAAQLPQIRHQQHGVFTAAQARAAGLTRHQLQTMLASGILIALRRGVYTEGLSNATASAAQRSCARAVAACLAWHGSVISHHSAAVIHGLPLLGARPGIPALTVDRALGHRGTRDRTVIVRTNACPPCD